MKLKIATLLLIITSLFGYLEWGGNNHAFLFEAEYDIFRQMLIDVKNIAHPFVLIPLLGQIVLLLAFFQKKPNKKCISTGMICISILLGFMVAIGIWTWNYKILLSTLPYFIVVLFTLRLLRTTPAYRD